MDKSSCVAREPLLKLDERGTASILNYNLPQATTYQVVSFIRLDVPERFFKEGEHEPPPGNYWERFDLEAQKVDLTPSRIQSVLNAQSYSGVREIMDAGSTSTPWSCRPPRV